jgi:hypothetical protein
MIGNGNDFRISKYRYSALVISDLKQGTEYGRMTGLKKRHPATYEQT